MQHGIHPPPAASRTPATVGYGLTAAFAVLFGVSSFSSYAEAPAKKPAPGIGGLSAIDSAAFTDRFGKEVWPIVSESCMPCHGQKNASQFLLAGTPRAAF